MSKKNKDTYSPFNKGMAKVLSTTLVVATVVTGVPMNMAVADDTVVVQDVTSAVDAVNNAGDNAALKIALEAAELGLDLGNYAEWEADDQTAVVQMVLAARGAGFTDKDAVQTEFDKAVATQKACKTVNLAATADTMKVALENPDLGLDLGVYTTWASADKVAVASIMLGDRPPSGFADKEAVAAAFVATRAGRVSVANFNSAADATSLQAALEDPNLDIDKSAYYALSSEKKTMVVTELLTARPLAGYPDMATIEGEIYIAISKIELGVAKDALVIGYADGDSDVHVTGNLNLTLFGLNDTKVTWESSDITTITPNGAVNRPSSATGNKQVTLTAKILDEATEVFLTKEFTLTVLHTEKSPAPLESDIVVKNNYSIMSDTVEVKGLQTGDVVTVYAADGTTLLAEGNVLPGSVSARLSIPQLGTTSGEVKVSVTRSGYEASELVTKYYVQEGAKAYTVTNPSMDRTAGVTATVRVVPTGNVELTGDKFVIFQLMNGTKPEAIVVKQSSDHNAETLTAEFNKPNNPAYSVRVFVVDAYGNDTDSVGSILANPVTIN